MTRNRALVLLALTIAIVCSALGDVAISQGMKTAVEGPLLNSYVLMGLGFHASFLLLYLFALSREELSYVLPVAALDYALVTLFAWSWAGEDVGALRWAGSLLISAGVGLVARS